MRSCVPPRLRLPPLRCPPRESNSRLGAARRRSWFRSLLIGVALAGAGCATLQPPQPWERGDLAKPSMQIDPDKLQTKIEQHIYTSKEAATGGYGVGGGGCGCN